MEGLGLLQIAVFLAAAAIAAPLAKMLKIGSVLGYLIAGFLIGPHAIGVIYQLYDVQHIRHIAEFGVVLLLFLIGLELRPKRIWAMRSAIFGLGGAQVVGSALMLMAFALLASVPPVVALFIGLSLALSSTAFVLQVLEEKGELNTRHGRLAFSVLLFQDLAAIPLIALVPLFAINQTSGGSMDLWAAFLAIATIVGVVVFGHYILNELYRLVAATKVREAMTASALLTVVGVALAMEHVGLSAALGSFIAGVILADSEYRHQIEADLAPFVGLLLGLFFMTIGMSLDIYVLRDNFGLVLLTAFGLVSVKYIIMYLLGRWRGMEARASRRLAIVLSQGGEFAFVLLGAGVIAHVLEPEQAKILSLAVTLSMITTPLLLLLDDVLTSTGKKGEVVSVFDKPRGQKGHMIIAGMGRFGQIISRVLSARNIPFTALDTSVSQINLVKKAGFTGYFGDATRLNILHASRVDKAAGFVIAVNNMEVSLKIAKIVRDHYPDLPIFARARNRRHVHLLMDLGVTVIRRETFLSAVELTKDILTKAYFESDETVNRDLERFKAHDRQRLYDDYEHFTDIEKLRERNKSAASELEELFAADNEKDKAE
ncbi:MAG: monovalent cation:proton antiporter-2 (CPA2) family protein [Hyphomicrobiaceae bacterium]|nr:monovalent cation:proton antiporter-2 (CPA2) family protein [Hyphomicrobiaceae bacterium]